MGILVTLSEIGALVSGILLLLALLKLVAVAVGTVLIIFIVCAAIVLVAGDGLARFRR